MRGSSVFEHLSGQVVRLCKVAGTDPGVPLDLLGDLLGSIASRPLSEPPAWPSNVADDHTPVEFSVAYSDGEPPVLRILAEALGSPPGALTNLSAAYRFLGTQARRFGLSMSRFDAVRDLFATEDPQGEFALWYSLVFRSDRRPEFKVYFNPELKGMERAPDLVAEALHRLGLGASYQTMLDRGVRPGELGRGDRLAFFALDLHDGPQARVKLYLTHHSAEVRDVVRAAGLVDGVDLTELAEFCAAAGGGVGTFAGRPLVGSYTLMEGAGRPVGYSVYVPIRSYVSDDEEARRRGTALVAVGRPEVMGRIETIETMVGGGPQRSGVIDEQPSDTIAAQTESIGWAVPECSEQSGLRVETSQSMVVAPDPQKAQSIFDDRSRARTDS